MREATVAPSAEQARALLVLRRPRDAVREAASCLNALACPGCPPPAEGAGDLTLPPALLPLDAADERAHAGSGPPMSVLLQSLCELGRPHLAAEVLRSCYLDLACAPFEVVWLGVQMLGLGGGRVGEPDEASEACGSEAAEMLVSDWLAADPPPRTLTAERGLQLLQLLTLRVLPTAAARTFLREKGPTLATLEELDTLTAELDKRDAARPAARAAAAEAAVPARAADVVVAAPAATTAADDGGPAAVAASEALRPRDAALPGQLEPSKAATAVRAAAAWLSSRLEALGPETAVATLAPLAVAIVAIVARRVLPRGWWDMWRRRFLRLCLPLLLPLRLALGVGGGVQ